MAACGVDAVNVEEKIEDNKNVDVYFWGRKVTLHVAKSIFKFFDKDNSGKLDEKEWAALLESYGLEDYTKELSALADADGCGKVCWEEFEKWLITSKHFDPGAKNAESRFSILVLIADKFKSYDKDNNGFITKEEFSAIRKDWQYPVSEEQFFKLVDKDSSGKVTFNEYYNFFFHPYMANYYPHYFGDEKKSNE